MIIGIGEMGGRFALALLRSGHVVVPVTREPGPQPVAEDWPDPDIVLVAVGEDDLDGVLESLPPTWRTRCGLLQNELLPRNWLTHGITDPTVAVVWFEKKPGHPIQEIIPTPIAGPEAGRLVAALHGSGIGAREVGPGRELQFELVRKNLYILTANIAGIVTGGTVGELWSEHRNLAQEVADEILSIQEALVGEPLDRPGLIAGMVAAFDADPAHRTTGRSAPKRLERALLHAAGFDIPVPRLTAIATDYASE